VTRFVLLLLATAALVGPAFATGPILAKANIDRNATVSANGRRLVVTGPVSCQKAQVFSIRVTVTQRRTAAVAEGRARRICTGVKQHWRATALDASGAPFKPGTAKACALGVTGREGRATDAHQWCAQVTLFPPIVP
jgi:hypothetical protein